MLSLTRSALTSEATAAGRCLAKPTTTFLLKRQFNSSPPCPARHPSPRGPSTADEGSPHDLLNFGVESTASLRSRQSNLTGGPPPTQPSTPHLDLQHPRRVTFPISFNAENLRQDDQAKLRASVRFQYFPECARLVREHLAVTRAVPFDWRQTAVQPAWSHADQSPRTSLRQAVGDEDAAVWMARRWVVVRVSRPLDGDETGNEVGIALEYDTQEGWWAENGASGTEDIDGACSIDVRVLVLLE